MEISTLILQGFFLGMALSPTCLGVCLPILLPYFSAEDQSVAKHYQAFLLFLGGRLIGYVFMGGLAGWLGQELILRLQSALLLKAGVFFGLGLLLVIFALRKNFPAWSLCQHLEPVLGKSQTPLLLGLLTGINICPPMLTALFNAGQTGSLFSGALVLTAFFLGTSLILLPAPMVGFLAQSKIWQWIGRLAAGLIGLWFILQAILYFFQK